ncbi:MAG: hypothetical protein ACFFD4_37240 [Candidatus Odinarchaeota archaeon]
MIVESFFVESRDNIFFDVKGHYQPTGWIVAYARYFPENCLYKRFLTRGKLRKSQFDVKNYYKFYDVQLRQNIIETCFPDYSFPDPRCPTVRLQGLPITAVKKVYNPMEYIPPSDDDVILVFLEEIENLTGSRVGITGSRLIGLNEEFSDIDAVLINPRAKCQSFYGELVKNLEKSSILRPYQSEELSKLYKDRKQKPPTKFTVQKELEKVNQGMMELEGKKIDFYIRLVDTDSDWLNYCSYDVLERVSFCGTILSCERGMLTPAIYLLELDTASPLVEKTGEEKIYIVSYRGRYAFNLQAGTRAYGYGVLEKLKISERNSTSRKNVDATHRIVIGGLNQGLLEFRPD